MRCVLQLCQRSSCVSKRLGQAAVGLADCVDRFITQATADGPIDPDPWADEPTDALSSVPLLSDSPLVPSLSLMLGKDQCFGSIDVAQCYMHVEVIEPAMTFTPPPATSRITRIYAYSSRGAPLTSTGACTRIPTKALARIRQTSGTAGSASWRPNGGLLWCGGLRPPRQVWDPTSTASASLIKGSTSRRVMRTCWSYMQTYLQQQPRSSQHLWLNTSYCTWATLYLSSASTIHSRSCLRSTTQRLSHSQRITSDVPSYTTSTVGRHRWRHFVMSASSG